MFNKSNEIVTSFLSEIFFKNIIKNDKTPLETVLCRFWKWERVMKYRKNPRCSGLILR
jgi:hypothetical protein